MASGAAIAESRWALFLDFDGTLVEIAPTPEAVEVDPNLPALLRRLGERIGAVAIVTGRDIAAIDRFLPGLWLDVCGLHGLERRVAGRLARPDFPDLTPEAERLERELAAYPALVIENKILSLAAHWRLAPEAEEAAMTAMAALAARLGPGYRLQDGKMMREVLPGGTGKGSGIQAMMREEGYRGRRPVFAGDDRTDEDGFRAVIDGGGVGIKVGPGPSVASVRVESVPAMRRHLVRWAETGTPPPSLLESP